MKIEIEAENLIESGRPGDPIEIRVTAGQTGFGDVQGSVTFNGIEATDIHNWEDSRIVVVVPADAVSGSLTVTYPGGSASVPFRVVS